MRFQLQRHGWPVGQYLIPEGTIIDAKSDGAWTNMARGRAPPPNAIALDDEAADLMFKRYPKHLVHTGPGVRR
jgi:hypothetical protein